MAATNAQPPCERDEILQALAEQRETFLIALRGLDNAQIAARTTVSDLTLGGLLKHLTSGERCWADVIANGDGALPDGMIDPAQYYVTQGDTLDGLLNAYRAASRSLDAVITALPNLDQPVRIPDFPLVPAEYDLVVGAEDPARLIRETAQHAGHADIIREALDGASTTAQLGT